MSDSIFNPDQFLQTTIDQANETKYTPVPEGDHPMSQIKEAKGRRFQGKTGDWFTVMELSWIVTTEEARSVTKQDAPIVRQTIFLNMTNEGAIDFGPNKNVQLGRLRDAVGQNRSGRPWSPSMLTGATATIHVRHRQDENGDPQAEVDRVAKG